MKYSIFDSTTRISFTKEVENTYIDWLISKRLYCFYEKYKSEYQVKNDVNVFENSYFEVLCDTFYSQKYKIPTMSEVYKILSKRVLNELINKYYSLYNDAYIQLKPVSNSFIIQNSQEVDEENVVVHVDSKCLNVNSIIAREQVFFKSLEDDDCHDNKIYEHAKKIAENDFKKLNNFLVEKQAEIKILLEEFKIFILGFVEFIKNDVSKEFNDFHFCYNFLLKDIQFFKNSKINSLSKYKFIIGSSNKKNQGTRGQTDDFVPAGTCTYGEKIFINSDKILDCSSALSIKRDLKNIFYHEVGHALDFVYFNDEVLRNEGNLQRSSYNQKFLKICKNNYKKLKITSQKTCKDYKLWLAYYVTPSKTYSYNSQSCNLSNDFVNIFNDIKANNQYIYKHNETFKTDVHYKNLTVNYSKPLIETWAESFALVFDWIRNGFSEKDYLILKKGRSPNRLLIKILHDSIIYILNNFNWTLLNIPYNVYLKKKRQILQYLKHIKSMPLYNHTPRHRTIKRQKFTTYKNLIKSI